MRYQKPVTQKLLGNVKMIPLVHFQQLLDLIRISGKVTIKGLLRYHKARHHGYRRLRFFRRLEPRRLPTSRYGERR